LEIEKRCVAEGIRGFFYEEDQLENLLKGVRAVLDGDWWLSREVMIKCILEGTDEDISSRGGLTRRQTEILAQVAVGASNEEIAEKLCVSPHTVKTHLYNVFKKINGKARKGSRAAGSRDSSFRNTLQADVRNPEKQ
jgi:LuxR family transcriptional regulator of csgAB operon